MFHHTDFGIFLTFSWTKILDVVSEFVDWLSALDEHVPEALVGRVVKSETEIRIGEHQLLDQSSESKVKGVTK